MSANIEALLEEVLAMRDRFRVVSGEYPDCHPIYVKRKADFTAAKAALLAAYKQPEAVAWQYRYGPIDPDPGFAELQWKRCSKEWYEERKKDVPHNVELRALSVVELLFREGV